MVKNSCSILSIVTLKLQLCALLMGGSHLIHFCAPDASTGLCIQSAYEYVNLHNFVSLKCHVQEHYPSVFFKIRTSFQVIALEMYNLWCDNKEYQVPSRRRQWHTTPVLLPGKSHGRRSLVGCSPWGYQESDTTERLHFDFSPSCIGKGNGNPLQCSCLENPRDGGAWWAAIYGVAQSWTQLKRLSISTENYKTLMKEIKDDINRQRDIPVAGQE